MWLRRNRALAQVFVGYKIMRRQTPGQNDPRTNSCSISEAKFYPTNSVNATGPLGHSLPRPQPPPSRAAGENSWRSVTRAITTPPVCERLHCKDEFKLCSYSSQPLFEFALATKTAWICSITIYKNKESINRKKPLSHMLANLTMLSTAMQQSPLETNEVTGTTKFPYNLTLAFLWWSSCAIHESAQRQCLRGSKW